MRIRVDTDYLWEVSRQLAGAANALRFLQKQLSASWGRLNIGGWEGMHRNQVEQEWQQAQIRLNGLADQAKALSHFLAERADRFEEADRTGLAAVAQATIAFAEAQQEWSRWFRPRRAVLSFPQSLAGRLLRLGGWEEQIPFIFVVTPSGRGNQLVGTRHLRSISPQWRGPLEETIEMQ